MTNNKNIKRLPDTFIGIGEVKGMKFLKVRSLSDHYVYKVDTGQSKHFEVIAKVINPICINFEKREYSTVDFKETYPKSKDFGKLAWTCLSSTHLSERLNKLGYE